MTFLFPGGEDVRNSASSDGEYDYRGPNCILALRDVILFAAGRLTDSQGRTIDGLTEIAILHDNIGLIGVSNGGNIIVAAAAMYGDELAGNLRYLVQWETPVSSQIATRDIGRVWLKPTPRQGDFVNPRYLAYGPLTLEVDYASLAYDPGEPNYPIFLDGNADGQYNTVPLPDGAANTPDVNQDGVLTAQEDFPIDGYPDTTRTVYSRPATQALAAYGVFGANWPSGIATVEQAETYWDLREAVRLYEPALTAIPDLEGMVLASVEDHVQEAEDKPHIHQAFEGWQRAGAWVQINPSPEYMIATGMSEADRAILPDNAPNTSPADWAASAAYAMPEDVPDAKYQLAAVWQMADRAQGGSAPPPAAAPAPRRPLTPTAVAETPSTPPRPTAPPQPLTAPGRPAGCLGGASMLGMALAAGVTGYRTRRRRASTPPPSAARAKLQV